MNEMSENEKTKLEALEKLKSFEDYKNAVARDVSAQYPTVDYLYSIVYNAMERHAHLFKQK